MNTSPSTLFHGQQGFSLVELLLVFGVLALIMTASLVVFPNIQRKNIINQTVNQWFTVRATLPDLVDPSTLQDKINRAVPIQGMTWELKSNGQGRWETVIALSAQGQSLCDGLAYELLSYQENVLLDGVPMSLSTIPSACRKRTSVFTLVSNIPAPVEPAPRASDLAAEVKRLEALMAAREAEQTAPVKKEAIEVDVDIYANQGPAQREKWNEAGGF